MKEVEYVWNRSLTFWRVLKRTHFSCLYIGFKAYVLHIVIAYTLQSYLLTITFSVTSRKCSVLLYHPKYWHNMLICVSSVCDALMSFRLSSVNLIESKEISEVTDKLLIRGAKMSLKARPEPRPTAHKIGWCRLQGRSASLSTGRSSAANTCSFVIACPRARLETDSLSSGPAKSSAGVNLGAVLGPWS